MYDIYKVEEISKINANEHFIIDESEFTSLNWKQIWVCGIINSLTKKYRLEVIENRNADNLEDFIRRFIFKWNIIVIDGWLGYNWLNANNSGYHHKVHVHRQHDFGFGSESTSIIESVWAQLKYLIKKIYNTIPPQKINLFLK